MADDNRRLISIFSRLISDTAFYGMTNQEPRHSLPAHLIRRSFVTSLYGIASFADVKAFRAKSSEQKENAWVLSCRLIPPTGNDSIYGSTQLHSRVQCKVLHFQDKSEGAEQRALPKTVSYV